MQRSNQAEVEGKVERRSGFFHLNLVMNLSKG